MINPSTRKIYWSYVLRKLKAAGFEEKHPDAWLEFFNTLTADLPEYSAETELTLRFRKKNRVRQARHLKIRSNRSPGAKTTKIERTSSPDPKEQRLNGTH